MPFFLDVKRSYKALILLKTNFSNKSKSTKKSRIHRRDCKIQRGIVKYYTAKSVGRARQGFPPVDLYLISKKSSSANWIFSLQKSILKWGAFQN